MIGSAVDLHACTGQQACRGLLPALLVHPRRQQAVVAFRFSLHNADRPFSVFVQSEAAQKERMEATWKAQQEKRAKAGEDFQTDQKSRAAVEKVKSL